MYYCPQKISRNSSEEFSVAKPIKREGDGGDSENIKNRDGFATKYIKI